MRGLHLHPNVTMKEGQLAIMTSLHHRPVVIVKKVYPSERVPGANEKYLIVNSRGKSVVVPAYNLQPITPETLQDALEHTARERDLLAESHQALLALKEASHSG